MARPSSEQPTAPQGGVWGTYVAYLERLEQDNADLLAALKYAAEWLDKWGDPTVAERIRAIAKAPKETRAATSATPRGSSGTRRPTQELSVVHDADGRDEAPRTAGLPLAG